MRHSIGKTPDKKCNPDRRNVYNDPRCGRAIRGYSWKYLSDAKRCINLLLMILNYRFNVRGKQQLGWNCGLSLICA
jgi:hypothetical protein